MASSLSYFASQNVRFAAKRSGQKPYRFGFILSTVMGNHTRYLNFRKYAEQDTEVDLVWAPITHYQSPDAANDWQWLLQFLPRPLRDRALVMQEAHPVLGQMGQLDAVMIHMFEALVFSSVRGLVCQQPLIINTHDDPPMVDPETYPRYAWHLRKRPWRQRFRLELDRWIAHQTDLFVPWSNWAANIYTQDCGVPQEKVHPIHVGIDLDLWQPVYKSANTTANTTSHTTAKPKLLFVGGDFERKGGTLLLDVFRHRFRDRAELHLVTKSAPAHLPANVKVHADLSPNDPRLAALYAAADIFVLPTRADLSSFACLEAMASSCPVISTQVGGIPDIVRHGETGLLINPHDVPALAQSIEALLDNPARRRSLGRTGRKVVEQNFSSAVNVPRILTVMKRAVDQQRAAAIAHDSRQTLERFNSESF